MDKCQVCEGETEVVFNINFKATPICERCASAITIQQVNAWKNKMNEINFVDFPLDGIIPKDIYRLDGEYYEVKETEHSGRGWYVVRLRDREHKRIELKRSYLETRVQLVPPSQRHIVKENINA